MNTQQLEELKKQFDEQLKAIADALSLEKMREDFFSRKSGKMSLLMKELGSLAEDQRKVAGEQLNSLRRAMEGALEAKKQELVGESMKDIANREAIDVTQPALPPKEVGHLHPVTQVQSDLEDFFTSMGFMVLDGPEVETEYFNFTALNIPEDHPARDMQDTFFVKEKAGVRSEKGDRFLMRTHTSPVQVRAMKEYGAPIRAIVPGRCFRNEATDARHEHTFYQLEGFVVDKGISFAHMKGVLEATAKHLYGEETKVRLRPKFYPFVEPGVNGEVTCFLCSGKGCRLCKNSGWLEIFGAGMIHPHVLKEGKVDSKKYSGFAFGFGLTRLVMLKYGIDDVRLLQSGDLRFLNQF